MKLIIAIVNKDDASQVSDELKENGFYLTKVSSTGGFLRKGNVTLLIGTENVDEAIKIIKENSQTRMEKTPVLPIGDFMSPVAQFVDVKVGGATIFVIDVEQNFKL